MGKLAWYENLNFDQNPLDARPNANLIGLEDEAERLKNHIVKEELCFLNGFTGSGKTSLLMKVQNELRQYEFIYLDAQDLPTNFNLEDELKKKRTFFDKIAFRQFPKKKPVLIIDEFQSTSSNLILEARGKWENRDRKIKSIVIAQISKYLKNVTDSFKDRLGNRMITVRPLDDFDMKTILEKRLNNKKTSFNYIKKLKEEALDLIIKVSDGNARRLLEYTDMVFDFHHRSFKDINPVVKKDTYYMSYHAVKEILERNGVGVSEFEKDVYRKTKVHFEDMFSPLQQRILEFLNEFDRVTAVGIAKKMRIALSTASKSISALKKQNAVMVTGKKRNRDLLSISPSVRRMMVRE